MFGTTPALRAKPLIIIQLLVLPSKVMYTQVCQVVRCDLLCGAAQHVDLHVEYHVNDSRLRAPQGKTSPEAAHDKRRNKCGDWEPVIQHV